MSCHESAFPQATPEDLFLIPALDADQLHCEAPEENVVVSLSYRKVVRATSQPNRESVKISHFEVVYQRGPFR